MKQETRELGSVLESYRRAVALNDDPTNHWLRRFFRCYIDGSYLGEAHYKANLLFVTANKNNTRRLRSFAINAMIDFLHIEFTEISRATIRKQFSCYFEKQELEAINKDLVDDLLDFIKD
jgi:hypothetical protein